MSTSLLDLARRLVGFDTTSSRSSVAAVEYLADVLDSTGFRVRVQRYDEAGVPKANLAASIGPPELDGLILSGHIDTVPFDGQPGWTRDPLRLDVVGDRIYGRGTSDMKVFLAQCVAAAGGLGDDSLGRPLVVLVTSDEEVGCRGAERLAPALPALLDVPVPRLAWIGEPTSFAVFHAHKAIGVFEIAVRGRGGHSGVPSIGLNAIREAGRVIEELRLLEDELAGRVPAGAEALFPEAPGATLNLGSIRGGTAANVIAEECRIVVSYRSLPDTDPFEVHREIAARLAALPLEAAVEVGEPAIVPSMRSPRGTTLERALVEAFGAGESRGALFTADGCRFAEAGITSLLCGPGDLAQAHQADEHISRSAFERGPEAIAAIVGRLCGTRV